MARKALSAPTVDYLTALKTQQESAFADDDTQIDRARGVRTLTRPVLVDERYRVNDVEVRDNTLTEEIQRVVSTLTLNAPSLRITPARPGQRAQENATLRSHWTEAVLKEAGSRLPGTNTFHAIIDAAVGDGGAWHKLVFNADLWETRYSIKYNPDDGDTPEDAAKSHEQSTEEAKKASGSPFIWAAVDVRTIYPVWSAGKLTEVLEIQERPLHSTLRQYRLGLDADGELVPEELGLPLSKVEASRVPRKVTFLEHWDDTWCSFLVLAGDSARVVKQFKHKYSRIPYFYAPGYTFNWQQGRKVGWGIGESKRWMVEYLSYLYTIHAQVAARDAFTPLMRKLPEMATGSYGDDNKPTVPEYWELRQIYNLKPGEELVPLQFPGVGPALREQIALVKEQIDKSLTPRVANNIGSGMEGAGFAINQVLAEARVTQDPIVKNVESSMEELTRFLWSLVRDRVQETVWVGRDGERSGWLGAGPDDLPDNAGVHWSLDPERPSAKLIEERYYHERMEKGTLGRHQSIVAMGDNPDEVDDDRELDRIRTTPWYQQRHDTLLMQKLERGDILRQAAQQAIATGILPGMSPENAALSGAEPARGMGTQAVPDMGALAAAPGGGPAGGPPPIQAGSAGAVVPQQSAAPGAVALTQ